jgi:hypothetical protein
VTTTEGNVFYSHKVKKESLWVIPEELKSALEALQEEKHREGRLTPAPLSGRSLQVSKRKAEDAQSLDEVGMNKRARMEEEEEDSEDEEEEEEDWQREAAEQLATEEEEERKRTLEREKEAELEAQRMREQMEKAVPKTVDLSIEEAKALFKVGATICLCHHCLILTPGPRHYFARKTLIHYILGTLHYQNSSPILDIPSFLP